MSQPGVLDSRVKELSNSPAYTFLDGLLRAGKLSQSQVEFYKVKYQKLHEVRGQQTHRVSPRQHRKPSLSAAVGLPPIPLRPASVRLVIVSSARSLASSLRRERNNGSSASEGAGEAAC